jgi:hypothetical protein
MDQPKHGLDMLFTCLVIGTSPTLLPCSIQVPMDQPKHGLDMITRFTRGEPLSTAGPSAASSYVRRPPADQSSARLLPGAMWQLRRAMPDRQASLTASGSEE